MVQIDFREILSQLSRVNKIVITNSDKELGWNQYTVKRKIDTGNHTLVKLRLYRTHIHKRELVGQAIQEMIDAGM